MIDDRVREMLDEGARNLRSNKNLTTENVNSYLALVTQFEREGDDLSRYRDIGEEMRRKLMGANTPRRGDNGEGMDRSVIGRDTPFYMRWWEAVKKIINYKVF